MGTGDASILGGQEKVQIPAVREAQGVGLSEEGRSSLYEMTIPLTLERNQEI